MTTRLSGDVSASKTAHIADEVPGVDQILSVSRRENQIVRGIGLLALVVLLLFPLTLIAQVAPGGGFPNLAPIDRHEVDSVDLMNNNVVLMVPIRSKSGAIPFQADATANSFVYLSPTNVWTPNMQPGTSVAGAYDDPFFVNVNGLWQDFGGAIAQSVGVPYTCGGISTTKWTNWVVITGDGTEHPLSSTFFTTTASGAGCQPSNTGITQDGSGITLSATGVSSTAIYDRDGTSIMTPNIVDRNGNKIMFQGAGCGYQETDSLGTVALTTCAGSRPVNFQWLVEAAVNETASAQITNLTLQTAFASGCGNSDTPGTTAYPMTTGYSFPDGTSLGFTYEGTPGHAGHYTGRIGTITNRRGGTITFGYSGGTNGFNCTYRTVPTLTRTQGNGEKTTYSLAYSLVSGSSYKAVNTVTDSGGNVKTYQFTGFSSTGLQPAPTTQALTKVVVNLGASTPLETDVYCYNTAYTSCTFTGNATSLVSLPIVSVIVMRQLAGMSTHSATEVDYDSYGNVTYSAAYDFGSTTPSIATTTTYGTWNGTKCVPVNNTHVNDQVCEVSTTQSGSTIADERFTRDANGNLTKTSIWNGTAWIGQSSLNTYNANGTLATSYDLANNQTTYTYNSVDYVGCTVGVPQVCNNYPWPTQVTRGGLTLQTFYDGTVGDVAEAYDPNGNFFEYHATFGGVADPYGRTRYAFPPSGVYREMTYPTGTSPTTFGPSMTFNGGNSIEAEVDTVDPYGHPKLRQVPQSPTSTTYDTLPLAYDYQSANVRKDSVAAAPCSAALGTYPCPANLWVETDTDPLGRTTAVVNGATGGRLDVTYVNGTKPDILAKESPAPIGENQKWLQVEKDGLNRISKICYIGNGSSTACGQATGTSNGVTDAYTYSAGAGSTTVSVTRGSQTRTVVRDAMGRITQKTSPEGGTTKFHYDTTDLTDCGHFGGPSFDHAGKLTCEVDAKGVQIVFLYDASGRLTDTGAWDGTTAICKRFRFDNSTVLGTFPSGVVSNNSLGRLTEASTDNCASYPPTTVTTDEFFSYDVNGNMTDMWEKTPHSTQYYHSVATFYDNGRVASLQLASPSEYTVTFGLDGEGRLFSTRDTTHSQNIATGATYFPTANPAVLSWTGADNDAYTYDSAARISNYKFTVGSANLNGALTWNSTDTLAALTTTDGFNAGGSLTCNSVYDDTNRVHTFDCGSGNWGQTYTYDQYDNLTKTQMASHTGTSWNPTYGPTTNHYACGALCTYDANGNVTGDGIAVYGWDPYSKLAWTATSGTPTCGSSGKCITYDAFGSIVETSNGSAWVERWYTQLGATANMSGTTINFAYWPAPMGGTTIEQGNGSNYYIEHKDFVGSNRITSNLAHVPSTDRAYTPYGEVYFSAGLTNMNQYNFSGLTANFDQGVMYDSDNRELSIVGRWLSPDPAGAGWNQYEYANSNGNSFIDPSGLCPAGQGNYNGHCYPLPGPSCIGGHNPNPLCKNSPTNPGAEAYNEPFLLLTNFDEEGALNELLVFNFGADPSSLGNNDVNCSLSIKANNKAGMNSDQLQSAEQQIGNLFGQSVDINFVSSGAANFTLNFANATRGNTLFGVQRSFFLFQSSPNVYVNNISNFFSDQSSSTINNIVGTVGAHELMHRITGIGDLPFDPSNPNDLMSSNNNPNAYKLFLNNGFQLTQAESQQLNKVCLSKNH